MTSNAIPNYLSKVFAELEKYTTLSDQAKNAFSDAVVLRAYKKGEFLLEQGQHDTGLYLLLSGMVRFVYLSADGKEYNKSFAAEGEFVGCLLSMLSAQCCRFSIQALENCQCLYLSNAQRKQLFQDYSHWERLGRILAIAPKYAITDSSASIPTGSTACHSIILPLISALPMSLYRVYATAKILLPLNIR